MSLIKSITGTAAGTRAAAGEVLKFPVIGIKRTVVRHTKTKDVTTEFALQMRPWELAPLAIGGLLAWWIVQGGLGNGTQKAGINAPWPVWLAAPIPTFIADTLVKTAQGPQLQNIPESQTQSDVEAMYRNAGWGRWIK